MAAAAGQPAVAGKVNQVSQISTLFSFSERTFDLMMVAYACT